MEGSCFLEVKGELQDPLHRWMLFNVLWALQENGEHKTVHRSHSLAQHCLSCWPEDHSVGMEKACLHKVRITVLDPDLCSCPRLAREGAIEL